MGRTAAWLCAAATSSGELPLDGASTAAFASSSRAAQSVCPSEAALNRGEQPLARQRFTSTLGLAASSSTTSAWPPCTAAKRAGGTTGADWSRSSRTADASPKTHARSTSEASRWWSSWLVGAGASAVRSCSIGIRWTLRRGPSLRSENKRTVCVFSYAGSRRQCQPLLLSGALAFLIPRIAAITRHICSDFLALLPGAREVFFKGGSLSPEVTQRRATVARSRLRRFLLHHTDARPTHTLQPTIHHGF